jgi:hypothetical protein
MRAVLDDRLLPTVEADMSKPRREPAQDEGRDVILLFDDGSIGGMLNAYHILVVGDTMWAIQGSDDLLAGAFAHLP